MIYLHDVSVGRLESALFSDGRIVKTGTGYETYYYLRDHLGSVRSVVRGDGRVAEINDYYPFGLRIASSGSPVSGNRFHFNGKELQTTGNLGYLDYGARMYDPALGRWLTADPMGEMYYSLSSYNYCANNPLLFIDPDGQAMDWYQSEDGTSVLWRNSQVKTLEISGDIYHNIGNSISLNIGGIYMNYYQDVPVSFSSEPVNGLSFLLRNPGSLHQLIRSKSSLPDAFKHELMANSIIQGQMDFLSHPVTQTVVNSLLFVATGGVEGVMALGNVGKTIYTNLPGLWNSGKTFSLYKTLKGGTETLNLIKTSTGVQRISTEYHHLFITQRMQKTYNLPNWLINNRLNVIKLNTIQHSLIDSYRFRFLRAGMKSDVGWFTKFGKK